MVDVHRIEEALLSERFVDLVSRNSAEGPVTWLPKDAEPREGEQLCRTASMTRFSYEALETPSFDPVELVRTAVAASTATDLDELRRDGDTDSDDELLKLADGRVKLGTSYRYAALRVDKVNVEADCDLASLRVEVFFTIRVG